MPQIVFITGPPGSGKSTLASAIAALDARVFSVDSDSHEVERLVQERGVTRSGACFAYARALTPRPVVVACCHAPSWAEAVFVIERRLAARAASSPAAYWPLSNGVHRPWTRAPALTWRANERWTRVSWTDAAGLRALAARIKEQFGLPEI